MAVRVSETMIFVRDMDEAIHFYTQQVGFKLLKRYDWGFAYIDIDGHHRLGLMLESNWDREYPDDENLPHARVALQTDDFEAEIERLRRAGVEMGQINEQEEGGQKAVTFRDMDGNAFFLWYDPNAPLGVQ